MADLDVRELPVGKINAAIYNPRVELLPGDQEYQQIEASLDEFGMVEPLVWNEHNGVLVGGHQRYNILVAKGRKRVPVSVVRIEDEERERALNLALNQGGRWDVDRLDTVLHSIESIELLRTTGFTLESLDQLRRENERQNTLGAIEQRMKDDPSYDPYKDPDKKYRSQEDGYEQTFEVTYTFTRDQRQHVQTAIAQAKELWGIASSMEALSQICEHFNSEANVKPGIE